MKITKDWIPLTDAKYPYSGMLSGLLKQAEIPFTTEGRMGAGLALKAGPLLESTRFYVPYTYYECAIELMKNISEN